ncbi:uncharacterized protein LOC130137754 isoform X2 [Syzygium oleosum]|uniref:uncharacterized protein LOC130137754 isoform X2 n=1 Tax=Syzygium oleosum TaxID=219896 RepID=UPI0024BB1632|nr:uncharacterized protein LOC130137754 isoform X2 [Syzygium oleosum]
MLCVVEWVKINFERRIFSAPVLVVGSWNFINDAVFEIGVGWHSLMLVRTEVYLKCGILGSSHFRRESHLLSRKATWRVSDFPASGLSQNLKVPIGKERDVE